MRWPGRFPAPISIRSGTPTAAATIISQTGAVSGTSTTLESLETSFHQDLNGDGTIGLVSTVIESFGSTSLVEVGNNYYLDSISSGTGPELKYSGAPSSPASLAAGRRSAQSRRQAAMRSPGRCQAPISTRSGTPTAAAISSPVDRRCVGKQHRAGIPGDHFHQDLNGDGTIGLVTHGDRDRSARPA